MSATHEVPDAHANDQVKHRLHRIFIHQPGEPDESERTRLNETGLANSRQVLKFLLEHSADGGGMGGNEYVFNAYIDALSDFLDRLETTGLDTAIHGNEFGTEFRHFPHDQISPDSSSATSKTLVVAAMGLNEKVQHGSASFKTWRHNSHYGSEIIESMTVSNRLKEGNGNPGLLFEEYEFYPHADPHWMGGWKKFGRGQGQLISHWIGQEIQLVGSRIGVVTDQPMTTVSEHSFKKANPTKTLYNTDTLLERLDANSISPDAIRRIPLGKAA